MELQRDQLKVELTVKLTKILDDQVAITQRSKSYAHFDKPLTDSTTGAILLYEADTSRPFLSSSLRLKCPIKASDTTKNDSSMKKVLEEAAAAHAAYQTTVTAIAKRTAAMEITLPK